jgi:hypothetical protein
MKIGLLDHFGTLNTRNESSLVAVPSHLRILLPYAEFCWICSQPEAECVIDRSVEKPRRQPNEPGELHLATR